VKLRLESMPTALMLFSPGSAALSRAIVDSAAIALSSAPVERYLRRIRRKL
jgi:hypothetical protein